MIKRLPIRFRPQGARRACGLVRFAGFIFVGLLFAVSCMAQEPAGGAAEASEAIWKWANFVILAIGLAYLIAKTLPQFFRTRTEGIRRSIVEAQQTKQDAERRAAEMDARLTALGSEIEKFRMQAREEMEQEAARIRNETAAHIRRLEQQAQVEIEAAGKAARRALRAVAAKLALELAERRIRTRLDANGEAALVDNFLNDLSRNPAQNGRPGGVSEDGNGAGAPFALEGEGSKN